MEIRTNFKGGGSFVDQRPQFSSNAEIVYVAWSNCILSYSTKTGKLLSKFKGVVDRIVGFTVHYYDSHECITACSTSGELITWKTVTHFKIRMKNIARKRVKTFNVISGSEETKALISYRGQQLISFILYDMDNDTVQNYSLKIPENRFSISVGKNYFAVICQNQLHCVKLHNFSKVSSYYVDEKRPLTCISCHPENKTILTGDVSGRVLVWQNIFSSKPAQSVFHWHTLPVKCVGFSATGSYFYSGGDECVLVRWQIDNHFEKKFLPRIMASIEHITVSPDNLFIAIATNDNAVRIVDPKLDQVCLIQHLVIGEQFESGIILDPRTKALVMNGNIGYVQFYSPSDGNLLYNMEVVGQNKISNERDHQMSSTEVIKIAISKSGCWLATFEERRDTEYAPDIRLKFWNFDLENQIFKLNTSIEFPHENKISSIQFQPSTSEDNLKCVTVGEDKKFKVWQLTDATTIYQKGKAWKCFRTGFYRDLSCKALAFATDGSLVAISFEEIVTTWLPDSCELKCSLVHPSYKQHINQLQFGVANQCHLVVAASNERLSVWNLLTLSMIWCVPVHTKFLIADTITTNMAVITQDEELFVFTPMSSEPVYSSASLLKKHKISAAAFIPNNCSNDVRLNWYERSPIFFIDSNKELYCVGGDEMTDTTPDYGEEPTSVFSMITPKLHTEKNQLITPLQHMFVKDIAHKNIKKYLEAPVHTMIPIRLLCASLLKSMVLQKK